MGPGLEIIGFSSFRGFPDLDDAFVDWFQGLVAETGLVLTACAVNTDVGIRRDRLLTDDELIDYMERQIAAAARLGFPLARVQISLTPDCDGDGCCRSPSGYGITLAIEVHAHQHPHHPHGAGAPRPLREARLAAARLRRRLGHHHLRAGAVDGRGLPPPRRITRAARRPPSSSGSEYYEEGPPPTEPAHGARFGSFIELAGRHGSPELGIDLAINATGLFGPARVESWLEIMPWVRHVHGKFFGIDAAGEEPSVPVRDARSPSSSRPATPAPSPASTRAGTGTTGTTPSTSSPASRRCSERRPTTPARRMVGRRRTARAPSWPRTSPAASARG